MAVTHRAIRKFYRGRDWAQARSVALFRAGHACRICGRGGKRLHVHHRIPVAQRWDLRLDPPNLEVLCDTHHREVHSLLRK